MTRTMLRKTLRRSYWVLGLVLAISLAAKLADHIPGIAGTSAEKLLKDVYDYLKDMALVLITVVAAYLANVFQKRTLFLTALKEEWRDIIKAKSALYAFTQLETPTQQDYLTAFCTISETIDNMRAVYGNVGETSELIGLYPYAPLHDMRRALQAIEPEPGRVAVPEMRKLARDAILQSFYALRETFLEELDTHAPDKPLLIFNGRRIKQPGTPGWARIQQDFQRERHDKIAPADPRIAEFLTQLYDKEHNTAKPWRALTPERAAAAAKRPDDVPTMETVGGAAGRGAPN